MKKERLFIAFFIAFSAVFLTVTLIFPGSNWDAIAYVAAAKSIAIKDKDALHTAVYDELRRSVSPQSYRALTTGTFNETVSNDPESLRQVLPFYRIKPAYVLLIYLLSKIGVNSFFAAHLVSATAVVLGLGVFFLAVRRRVDPYLLFMLPVFAVALGAFQVARIITPDGLAFLAVALIFYFFLADHWLVLLLLPLSIFIRTDLIFFVLLLLLYLFATHRRWRLWSAGAMLLATLLLLGIHYFAGAYDYATQIWVSFVESVSYPAEVAPKLTLPLYSRILLRGMLDVLHYYTSFLGYSALIVLTVLLFLRISDMNHAQAWEQRAVLAISLIAFLSVIVHFLLFPAMWPRFFSGQYFIAAMVLLIVLTSAMSIGRAAEIPRGE